jgi:catalase
MTETVVQKLRRMQGFLMHADRHAHQQFRHRCLRSDRCAARGLGAVVPPLHRQNAIFADARAATDRTGSAVRNGAARVLGGVLWSGLLATLAAHAEEPVAASEVINSFEETFDVHAEQGTNHGGVCARGEFVGTARASALSRSGLFAPRPVPVIAKYSVTGANQGSRNAREMALEFHLPDGSVQDMVMLDTPIFATPDPMAFREMIAAAKPDPDTGRPDPARLRHLVAARPDAFAQSNFQTASDPPYSYANSAYYSIHAFRFINAQDRIHFVRWRFIPRDAERRVRPEEVAGVPTNLLDERFGERLASGPVQWDMTVYLGESGDATDNASIAWPEGRKHLKAGTLTITQVLSESAAECRKMNVNPLMVADGIAPTDDPVLLFRSPTYAIGFVQQLSQALGPVHEAPVVAR